MGTNKRGKEKEREIFPDWQKQGERERRGKDEFEDVFKFLSAEPTSSAQGQTLLFHVLCSGSGGSISSSSGSSSAGVGVNGEERSHAHSLIRWLIKLPVRQASAAPRGCLSEVRVRATVAAQLFIVLT